MLVCYVVIIYFGTLKSVLVVKKTLIYRDFFVHTIVRMLLGSLIDIESGKSKPSIETVISIQKVFVGFSENLKKIREILNIG